MTEQELFIRIVNAGSLAAVARELRTEPSTVSRRLRALEDRLGVRLIRRSRVRSVPTDAGQRYYQTLRPLLEQLSALEADVSGSANEPSGVLRVA
ncbi:MAG: LysR family transcriptional regulator, partial [Myxococcota bacterium]